MLPEEFVPESWRSSVLGSVREADTAVLEILEVIAGERDMRKLLLLLQMCAICNCLANLIISSCLG